MLWVLWTLCGMAARAVAGRRARRAWDPGTAPPGKPGGSGKDAEENLSQPFAGAVCAFLRDRARYRFFISAGIACVLSVSAGLILRLPAIWISAASLAALFVFIEGMALKSALREARYWEEQAQRTMTRQERAELGARFDPLCREFRRAAGLPSGEKKPGKSIK